MRPGSSTPPRAPGCRARSARRPTPPPRPASPGSRSSPPRRWGAYGVTVNAIAPVARTRMTEGAFDTSADGAARGQLPGRRLARLRGGRRRHRPGDRDRRQHASPSRPAGRTAPPATPDGAGTRPTSAPRCASCWPRRRRPSRSTAPDSTLALRCAGEAAGEDRSAARRRAAGRAGRLPRRRLRITRGRPDPVFAHVRGGQRGSRRGARGRATAVRRGRARRAGRRGEGRRLQLLPRGPARARAGGVVLARHGSGLLAGGLLGDQVGHQHPGGHRPGRRVPRRSTRRASTWITAVAGDRLRGRDRAQPALQRQRALLDAGQRLRRADPRPGPDRVRRGADAAVRARHGVGLQQRRHPDPRRRAARGHRPGDRGLRAGAAPRAAGDGAHPDDQDGSGHSTRPSSACSRPARISPGSAALRPGRGLGRRAAGAERHGSQTRPAGPRSSSTPPTACSGGSTARARCAARSTPTNPGLPPGVDTVGRLAPGAPGDLYAALGFGGQVVLVDPASQTVVVRLGVPGDPESRAYTFADAARVVTEVLRPAS